MASKNGPLIVLQEFYKSFHFNVIRTDHKFRMYISSDMLGLLVLVESDDGVHWHSTRTKGHIWARQIKENLPRFLQMKGHMHEMSLEEQQTKLKMLATVDSEKVSLIGITGRSFSPVMNPKGQGHGYLAASGCAPHFFSQYLNNGKPTEKSPDIQTTEWEDICGYKSVDGIAWERVPGKQGIRSANLSNPDLTQAAIAPGPSDSTLHISSGTHGLHLTSRYEFVIGELNKSAMFHWRGVRGIRTLVANSTNLNTTFWRLGNAWRLDAELGTQEHFRRMIYQVSTTQYAGVHFGLMDVLEWPRCMQPNPKHGCEGRGDVNRIYISTSRDGIHFDLRWIYASQPLHSPDEGQWNSGVISPAAQFVTFGGFHWVYYRACGVGHDTLYLQPEANDTCAIGLMKYRQDGLAHLTTTKADIWSIVRTRWFRLQGQDLIVNVDFKGVDGVLEVVIISNGTREIVEKSKHHTTGGIDLKIEWASVTGDLSAHVLKVIQVEFRLRSADLLAFQVVAS